MTRISSFLVGAGVLFALCGPCWADGDDELDALRSSAAEEADSKPKAERKAWSAQEQDAHDHDHDHDHAHDHGKKKAEHACECCDSKKEGDHAGHDHAGHDHAGHDHSGHDHAGHDHAGHDHAGHDHSGHDHAGHDHAAHEHEETPAEESPKTAPGSAGCSVSADAPRGLSLSLLLLGAVGLGAVRFRGGAA